MFKNSAPIQSTRHLASLTVSILSACIAIISSTAHAQVYRIVGPDGRVTYSDRPASSSAVTPGNAGNAGNSGNAGTSGATSTAASSSTAALPYELRQVATRYPVTLYTAKNCEPCSEARSFLQNRGVPFNERTIETNSDVDALKKLSGQDGLPFATIGAQHVKGFADEQWTPLLKAAGYPAQSQLPKNYQAPAATPLTTPAPVAAEKKAPEPSQTPRTAEPSAPASAPSGKTTNNPAGLRF